MSSQQQVGERLRDHPKMPRIGSVVADRYEILEVLGEGGFAVVFKSRDVKLGGFVALKVLEPAKSVDGDFAKRFEQEINLVRALRHHNTIKIWDAGMTDWGCLYCAMEMVDGEDLSDLLKRSGGLPADRVIRIASQVLRSLSEAHDAGIIHRDLKPGNIRICQLADEPDYVKVLDFGIAKARAGDLSLVKTSTGLVMCTPQYAAPELLRNQGNLCPASDLYALGLIMVEMLTGQQAVQATSMPDLIAIQVSPYPIPVDPRVLTLPIAQVIQKVLAKQVDQRYQSAREMLTALHAVAKLSIAPVNPPTTPDLGISNAIARQRTTLMPQSGESAPVAAPPKQTLVAVLVLLVVVLALGLGGVLLSQSGGDGAPGDGAQPEVSEALSPSTEAAPGVAVSAPGESAAAPVDGLAAPAPSAPSAPDPEAAVAPPTETPTEVAETASDGAAAIATAAPAPGQIDVELTSEPSDVRVYLDGEVIGRTPFHETLWVDGEADGEAVELTLRQRNFETVRVTVAPGDSPFVRHLELTPDRERQRERRRRDEREPEPSRTLEAIPLDFN